MSVLNKEKEEDWVFSFFFLSLEMKVFSCQKKKMLNKYS